MGGLRKPFANIMGKILTFKIMLFFCFLRLQYNYILSHLLFLLPSPLTFHFLFSFKSMASLFIHCCLIHIFIYIYTPIHKYNFLNLCNVICIYVFRTDHLADSQLMCSSLGKGISCVLRIPKLPAVLCVWLIEASSCGLSPIHLITFSAQVGVIMLVRIRGVTSDFMDSLRTYYLILWNLQFFCSFFFHFSLNLRCRSYLIVVCIVSDSTV